MTYCVGISLKSGLVLASDSRTNAGSDQVSQYGKMHTLGIEGERQFVLLSACRSSFDSERSQAVRLRAGARA